MSTTPEFAATEKRVFSAFWQDGVLDLLAGVALLSIGIAWLLHLFWLTAVVPGPFVVMWPILRRTITEPRLGQVRFQVERRHSLLHGSIAVLCLGLISFGFMVIRLYRGGDESALLRWLTPAIPSLLLALLALSIFGVLRLLRLLVYAAVLVAAGLIVAALDLEPGWAMLSVGVVITITGMVRLIRFLREFPRLPQEFE
jgi:hypothetical protein